MNPNRRPYFTLGLLALTGTLICAAGCSMEQAETEDVAEVESAVAVGPVIEFVQKFYDNVFKVAGWIKKKPTDPATAAGQQILSRIEAAETVILQALDDARWQNSQYVAAELEGRITTVLDNYQLMLNMAATDADLLPLRLEMQVQSDNILNQFAAIVERNIDVKLSYELAPAYNLLLATYTGLLLIKGNVQPNAPMPILAFQTALTRGVQTNYKMIGSRSQGCSASSYIPRRDAMYIGRDPITGVTGDLVAPKANLAFRGSQFFKDKFSDRWVTWARDFTCNVKQNLCTAAAFYEGSNNGLPQRCDGTTVPAGLKQTFQTCISNAKSAAIATAFNADEHVRLVRESMRLMYTLGAVTVPTTGGAFPGLNPAVGSYFDPVVKVPYPGLSGEVCAAGRRTYIITH